MGYRSRLLTSSRARHVLVVDDDASTRETLRGMLRTGAYTVSLAATARAAVESVKRHTPNLALIDLRLTDGTGFDLVRAFARERISVPWILMSGFIDYGAAVEAGRLGALTAVPAGFDVEQVVSEAFRRVDSGRLWPIPPLKPRLPEPGTSAEYLAWLMLWQRPPGLSSSRL